MPDTNSPTSTPPQEQAASSRQSLAVDPCAMVIFGATGDLTKRLVMPALYNLARTNLLPKNFALIGVARGDLTTQDWINYLYESLQSFVGNSAATFNVDHIDEAAWKRLTDCMSFVQGDLTEDSLYSDIAEALDAAAKAHDTKGNAIFYLAIADQLFGTVIDHLGNANLTKPAAAEGEEHAPWRRVVIEKPFGHDLESARKLNHCIRRSLDESQIFRIDHFLGKEAVQSIMAFRFGNGLFEPIWNRDRIDHVQITVAETVGVEARGKFYEATGALRDMVPNHIFTLVSMVAMEPPIGFDAASIHGRKAEVFAAMPAVSPARAVRGQYRAGTVLGKEKRAYRQEADVSAESDVETYVAMRLEIDNWRWAGVPFYVRTGKHLCKRVSEIAICFKPAPYAAFQNTKVDMLQPNWLVLRISPQDGISLQFAVKRRGPSVELADVKMDFHYDDWFPKEPNVGYEILIHDVMLGDQTLFMRADMVEEGWRVVQPVLDAWAADQTDVPRYVSGTDGPKAAEMLLADSGRTWCPIGCAAPGAK